MRSCKGALSIVKAKMKNNQLANHSLRKGAQVQGL